MDLSGLDPQFLCVEQPGTYRHVDTAEEADGIMFLCPVCFKKNGGPIGTHSVICWTPAVSLSEPPGPGRWRFEGTGYEDLTLVAGSSSILLKGGCNAHFFIRSGKIV